MYMYTGPLKISAIIYRLMKDGGLVNLMVREGSSLPTMWSSSDTFVM